MNFVSETQASFDSESKFMLNSGRCFASDCYLLFVKFDTDVPFTDNVGLALVCLHWGQFQLILSAENLVVPDKTIACPAIRKIIVCLDDGGCWLVCTVLVRNPNETFWKLSKLFWSYAVAAANSNSISVVVSFIFMFLVLSETCITTPASQFLKKSTAKAHTTLFLMNALVWRNFNHPCPPIGLDQHSFVCA